MNSMSEALVGGGLIGLAAAAYLLLHGRIAGISGIVGSLLQKPDANSGRHLSFLAGLLAAPWLCRLLVDLPRPHFEGSTLLLLGAGLLVGVGTSLGSGCTSGHGVCGLARLAPRSLLAVVIFMACAIVTAALHRYVAA